MSKREIMGSVNSTFWEKVLEESYLQRKQLELEPNSVEYVTDKTKNKHKNKRKEEEKSKKERKKQNMYTLLKS